MHVHSILATPDIKPFKCSELTYFYSSLYFLDTSFLCVLAMDETIMELHINYSNIGPLGTTAIADIFKIYTSV